MEHAVFVDKWYYIMDKGFFYYRLNQKGQLVATANKDEADIFSYEEGCRRIGNGRKANFYALVSTDEDVVEIVEQEKAQFAVIDATFIEQERASGIVENAYDLSKLDWLEYIRQFLYISSSAKTYHDELNEQLSEVDQKICDILHYIELYELSETENLEVMEQLKQFREERREIKNCSIKVDTFTRLLGTSGNIAKSKEAIRAIEGLENRKYAPRKLAELFENGIEKSSKRDAKYPRKAEETELLEYTEENDMNPTNVEYTWEETVFDNKENNWQQYAKEQMDFFSNAYQYINNLKIELEDIDGKIQNILCEIEDANYNAVQGFKVFKELKELRNVRKEKINELRCIEVLTERFDCEAMAEAYGRCFETIGMLREG